MREQWDRWGWVVALVIIAIGFLRLVWGREAFCGPDTEHCLREWLSALGGWAAVAAAVPTVIFLSRQVTDARKFNKKVIKIQAMPILHDAWHVASLCSVLISRVNEDLESFKNLSGDNTSAEVAAILEDIKYTLELVSRNEFNGINKLYGTYLDNTEAINNLSAAIRVIEENEITNKNEFAELTQNLLPSAYFATRFFAERLLKAAEERIQYADSLLEL
ncbi:hypothetical protein ACC676_09635 [Rhizobium ruizarguesonis]